MNWFRKGSRSQKSKGPRVLERQGSRIRGVEGSRVLNPLGPLNPGILEPFLNQFLADSRIYGTVKRLIFG